MQKTEEIPDVGVIVGRFQVHNLHRGHREIIEYVANRHSKVIIFLGISPLHNSTNNPLDFESRKQMILAEFPNINVLYVKDAPSDEAWSKDLDSRIVDMLTPNQSVVIYGGRDSFIAHYSGKYATQELMQSVFESGTAIRREIARSSAINDSSYRAGLIKASQSRFPTSYQCVDVAVFDADYSPAGPPTKILLGKKKADQGYRFFGGFVDPSDPDLETSARREVAEEANIEIHVTRYIGSANVPDWRYANEPDCIKTAIFFGIYSHGKPEPKDDLDGGEVRWFSLKDINRDIFVPQHRHLYDMLIKKGVIDE